MSKNKLIGVSLILLLSLFVSGSTDITNSLITTSGNITGSYYFGNGTYLTDVTGTADTAPQDNNITNLYLNASGQNTQIQYLLLNASEQLVLIKAIPVYSAGTNLNLAGSTFNLDENITGILNMQVDNLTVVNKVLSDDWSNTTIFTSQVVGLDDIIAAYSNNDTLLFLNATQQLVLIKANELGVSNLWINATNQDALLFTANSNIVTLFSNASGQDTHITNLWGNATSQDSLIYVANTGITNLWLNASYQDSQIQYLLNNASEQLVLIKAVPTYTAGNGITLDGTMFSVAAITQANITDLPTCGAGEVVNSTGSALICQAVGGGSGDVTLAYTRINYLNYTDSCAAGQVYEWGTGCIATPGAGTADEARPNILTVNGVTTTNVTLGNGNLNVTNILYVNQSIISNDQRYIKIKSQTGGEKTYLQYDVRNTGADDNYVDFRMYTSDGTFARFSYYNATETNGQANDLVIAPSAGDIALTPSGNVNVQPSGDLDDYLQFGTERANVPSIKVIGGSNVDFTTDGTTARLNIVDPTATTAADMTGGFQGLNSSGTLFWAVGQGQVVPGDMEVYSLGEVNILPNGDQNDYLQFSSDGTTPAITDVGGSQMKFFTSGQPKYEGRYGTSDYYNYFNLYDGYSTYGGIYLYNVSGGTSPNSLELLHSAGGINIKPSGDTNDYLSFSTVSDVPQIGIKGGGTLKLTTDVGTPYIQYSLDATDAGMYGISSGGNYSFFVTRDTGFAIQTGVPLPIDLKPNGNVGDYLRFQTITNIPNIGAIGGEDIYFYDTTTSNWNTIHADAFTEHTQKYNGTLADIKRDLKELTMGEGHPINLAPKETKDKILKGIEIDESELGTNIGLTSRANSQAIIAIIDSICSRYPDDILCVDDSPQLKQPKIKTTTSTIPTTSTSTSLPTTTTIAPTTTLSSTTLAPSTTLIEFPTTTTTVPIVVSTTLGGNPSETTTA